jgi:hypothetical protein
MSSYLKKLNAEKQYELKNVYSTRFGSSEFPINYDAGRSKQKDRKADDHFKFHVVMISKEGIQLKICPEVSISHRGSGHSSTRNTFGDQTTDKASGDSSDGDSMSDGDLIGGEIMTNRLTQATSAMVDAYYPRFVRFRSPANTVEDAKSEIIKLFIAQLAQSSK